MRECARRAEGPTRRRILRAVSRAPARRLLLRLLPGRQPPRRRGPHRADLPAGLPPLRARAARVATAGRCARGSSASPTTWRRTTTATARASRRRRSTTPTRSRRRTRRRPSWRAATSSQRILEGVNELPDDRREALIMRFALGMDNREIARAIGRTDGATKVLIHRAIRQLEEIVEAERRDRSDERERRHVDFEVLLRRALAPVEPPERPADRLETHAGRADRAGRRRARGVGAGRDARPAQLGAPGGRARRSAPRPAPASCVLRARGRATAPASGQRARRSPSGTLRDVVRRGAQAARRRR